MENRPKKKLLALVREAIWRKHYSKRTEESYIHWIKRYIFFHNKRHPMEMGYAEIEAFLTHLAIKKQVSASTQNQAFSAFCFFTGKCSTNLWKVQLTLCGRSNPKDCRRF